MQPAIETRGLQKDFIQNEIAVRALRGVDLAVAPGEFVAIMGPSGSGKSTLLHLLGGLEPVTRGEIHLGATPVHALLDRELTLLRRRKVGVVFQFFNLMPSMTAAENVALPLLLDGIPARAAAGRSAEALAWVDLAERAHHTPDRLSGGEQQRAALARALVTRPDILLADEPTGNLDSASGERVLALLRRACDETQQTVIMVTHDPAAAARADRVVFLYDGRIVDQLRGPGLTVEAVVYAQSRLAS
jgi:putative ABC transport system ATP-binding protein